MQARAGVHRDTTVLHQLTEWPAFRHPLCLSVRNIAQPFVYQLRFVASVETVGVLVLLLISFCMGISTLATNFS